MARNQNGLTDQSSHRYDWIELYNPSGTDVNLGGYHLTDSASDPTEWTFPANTMMPAGSYLVVFATGQDTVSGPDLHANIKLDGGGGYLGLNAVDGKVLSSYDYPAQVEDVSYGVATQVSSTSLLATGNSFKVKVPTDSLLDATWKNLLFSDSGWTAGQPGVGYDVVQAPPRVAGYTIKMVDFSEAIGDIATATRLLNGDYTGYTTTFVGSQDYAAVNHGVGGNFAGDLLLPTGVSNTDTYVLRATADVFIPAGTWTLDVASDDGASLRIPGATFSNRVNENGSTGASDTIMWSAPRGHAHTSGTITVGAGGLNTQIIVDYYENGGGDDVELSFASGTTNFAAGGFQLLSDGLSGWQVKTTSSTPPPNYTSIIKTNIQGAMLNVNATAYVRVAIPYITNPTDYDTLQLRIRYDDGFVAWINGQEFARRNAPATLSWNSAATADHATADALKYEEVVLTLPTGMLVAGANQNVLTIQGLNTSVSDNNFLIDAQLYGLKTIKTSTQYFTHATPGGFNDAASTTAVVADTKFSVDRGFFTAPFQVAISTATTGASIRYTTDGTWPSSTNGIILTTNYNPAAPPAPITISGTTVLRAMAYMTSALSTNVDTETYIFTADVVNQSPTGVAPANFPASWLPNVTDYGMDPNIVNSSAYGSQIQPGLISIPTMSIVMDTKDLFDTTTGIYANASGDGQDWERPASLELIYPDGTTGFQANAGIRIRGGYSRSTNNPKHGFRFFFRDEYGQGKLDYPLFGPNGPQSFDKFDLRTFENYSWSFDGSTNGIFVRDQVNRDMQVAMGELGSHGQYYQLYINGQYWGLYNTDERPEANFGAQYLGGDPANFDTIKTGPDFGYSIYATDGNMDAWTQLWNGMYNVDLTNNANYFKLMGLNVDGTRNPAYPVLLDVDNLIDYMLVIFYGGNLDAPLSNFLENKSPNNFFAIRDRTGEQGFKFVVHDAEHTLLSTTEDRTGPYNTISTDSATALSKSNPQYMFQLLEANPEFRLRVADRIHKFMFNNSVLTPAGFSALFNARTQQISQAVYDESARWGDSKVEPPLNHDTWQTTVNYVANTYIPGRTATVFAQLQADNLYPTVAAPEFNQNGGTVSDGFQASITRPGGLGTIYYTLDGSDPRAIGGGVRAGAMVYGTPLIIHQTSTIKARILYNGYWSALTEWTFALNLSAVRITEVMYNPPTPPTGSADMDPQHYEFIELQNTSSAAINLLGAKFTAGIDYTFPSYILAAGARAVVVKNQAAFQARYGTAIAIIGFYGGSLDNNGEQITLSTPAATIEDFTYNDKWYPQTDGGGVSVSGVPYGGFSLVPVNSLADNATLGKKSGWRSSFGPKGTPGAGDTGPNPGDIIINELMANTTAATGDWVELRNTTASPIDLSGWFLSDHGATDTSDTDLARYQIPSGTIIPANGYLTFTQAAQFGNPAAPGASVPFVFDSGGENVYLTSVFAGLPGGYRESQNFGAAPSEISYGYYTKSTGETDFTKLSAPTFGAANAYPLVGPLVISEIMYQPVTGGDEFIELRNLTAAPLPLYEAALGAGWTFVDGVGYTFQAGAVIPAGGFALVVPIDPATFRAKYGIPANVPIYGPYTKSLDNNGEEVKISQPVTPEPGQTSLYISIDHVEYDEKAPWPVVPTAGGLSISRKNLSNYGNDPANWILGPSGGTPGMAYDAPVAPINAVASTLGADKIHITWSDTSSNEQGFKIERSTDNTNFTQVGTAAAGMGQFDAAGLTSATLYYFRVRAYNAVGDSPVSNATSAITYTTQTLALAAITDTWKYNDSATDLGTSWIATIYNDAQTGWKSGGGLFYFEDAALPAAKTTSLLPGSSSARTPTMYFRKHVTVGFDPAMATFSLRSVVDDAFALYINGNLVPAYSLRMPATWSYGTYVGGTAVGDAVYEGPFTLPSSYFVQGDNVIAVEVHQVNNTSGDIVWGGELTVVALVPVQTVSAAIGTVTPDPVSGLVTSVQMTFPEAVNGVDYSDLRLYRNGGANLLTSAQTVSASADKKTFTISNLDSMTWVAGSYTLQIVAGNSGITTVAGGKLLGADVLKSFTVATTAIPATAAADSYYMRLNGSSIEIFTTATPVGSPKYSAVASDVTALTVDLGTGNDTFNIADGFNFTPNIIGGAGTDTLIVSAGSLFYTGDLSAARSIETVNVGGGSLTLSATQHLGTLSLSNSGRLVMSAGGSSMLRANSLAMSGTAVIDLQDNDMVMSYSGASPITAIRQYLLNGRIGAAGPQIVGSLAQPAPGYNAGVAAVDNTLLHLTQWGSETISNGSVFSQIILKFTWLGDTNLDGKVTDDDYTNTIANMGRTGTASWIQGDLNLDGQVTADDFAIVTSQLGAGAGTGPVLAGAIAASAMPSQPAVAKSLSAKSPAKPKAKPKSKPQAKAHHKPVFSKKPIRVNIARL